MPRIKDRQIVKETIKQKDRQVDKQTDSKTERSQKLSCQNEETQSSKHQNKRILIDFSNHNLFPNVVMSWTWRIGMA